MFPLTFWLLTLTANLSTAEISSPFIVSRDADNPYVIPTHMRSMPSLQASGSAQPSEVNLGMVLNRLPTHEVIIVDLRGEPHGLVNGIPVSWINVTDDVESDEATFLFEALQRQVISLVRHEIKETVAVDSISTERGLIESLGVCYVRLPVTDHCKPTPEIVDRFVAFVQSLPPTTWLHFHCKMGMGRTGTFLILYDIIRNSNKFTLDEIYKRQIDLAGKSLVKVYPPGHVKHQSSTERKQFIEDFYHYWKETQGNIPFSDYLKSKTT